MSRLQREDGLVGIAKVGVFCPKLDESRDVHRGTVEGLKQTFREQNHRDYDASNYIPVLLNETELSTISTAFGENPQELNRLTIHAKYSDGEVYCNVRHSEKTNDEMEIAAWKGKLTNCKRISLDQLLKREDLTELFDRLIPIPGLWIGLELGNIQKNLALRCDEEIKRYLAHIRSVWEKVTLSDTSIQMATDVETVRLLQLRVPSLSRSDWKFINSEMASGKLFPKIIDPKTRQDILEAILRVDCLIPSLKTMHENLKYLEVGAKILKDLLIAKSPRFTIYNALRSAWTYNGTLLVENKDKRSHIKGKHSNETAWGVTYKQIWIWALRNFSELGGRAPRKEHKLSPYQPTVDPILQYEFVKFVKEMGIKTRKIESRLQSDARHKTMLTSICQIYPSHKKDEIERVAASFVKKLPFINSSDKSSVDSGERRGSMKNTPSPMDLSRRWGVPFAKSYTTGKKEFYLTCLLKTSYAVGDDMPSHLFVLQDFIFSFFGGTADFEAAEIMNPNEHEMNNFNTAINTNNSHSTSLPKDTPPETAGSSSYPSVDGNGGPSSLSRAPMNRDFLQSSTYLLDSQSQHSSPKDEMDFVFDSSIIANNGPVKAYTDLTPSQAEIIDERLESENDQDLTLPIGQEPLADLDEAKNGDSQHNIQETDIYERRHNARRKIPDIQVPNNISRVQNQHNEEKGKRNFGPKTLTRGLETSQSHRSPLMSMALETSSSDRDIIPFNNQLTYRTDIPNRNIENIIWNVEETPTSPARSLGLSDVSPFTSTFEQEASFSNNHVNLQSGTHSQDTRVITPSRSESARSLALLTLPPELSLNYRSSAESSEQQLIVLQPRLQEAGPIIGDQVNVPKSVIPLNTEITHGTITGRELSPEDVPRSPIMSTIGIDTSLWQGNVVEDVNRTMTTQARMSRIGNKVTIDPQYMRLRRQALRNTPELSSLRSSLQPINYIQERYRNLTNSSNLIRSENIVLAATQTNYQTMKDEPINNLIVSSQLNIVPDIIEEDKDMQDISTINLEMELLEEARRSIPLTIDAMEENLPTEQQQSNETSLIIGSDENTRTQDRNIRIQEKGMRYTPTMDMAIELPEEPRRSIPLAIDAMEENLPTEQQQSNETSLIIGSDEGIRTQDRDIQTQEKGMRYTPTMDMAMELPEELRRSMPIPLPSEISQTVIINVKDKNSNISILEKSEETTLDKSTITPIVPASDDRQSLVLFNTPQSNITENSTKSPTFAQPEIMINEFNGMKSQHRIFNMIEDVKFYLDKRHDWALVIETPNSRGLKTIPAKQFLQHIEKRRTINDVYYCFRRQHYEKMKKQSRDRKDMKNPLLNKKRDVDRRLKKEQLRDIQRVKIKKKSEERAQSKGINEANEKEYKQSREKNHEEKEQPEQPVTTSKWMNEKEEAEQAKEVKSSKLSEISLMNSEGTEQLKESENSFRLGKEKHSEQRKSTKKETAISNLEGLRHSKLSEKASIKPEEVNLPESKTLPVEQKETFPKHTEFNFSQTKPEGMNSEGENDIPYSTEKGKRKYPSDLYGTGIGLRKNKLLESEPTKRRKFSESQDMRKREPPRINERKYSRPNGPKKLPPFAGPVFKNRTTHERLEIPASINGINNGLYEQSHMPDNQSGNLVSGGPRGSIDLFSVED
ncbi:hypothetical protein OCU04_009832 [Sclerotinia nivalis]|uniref:Uncharacterized protein n=1 Tax=Sclerotinia nivalis TaxID=352851 RepID=A0A9X0AFW0_9HELO|nr:hypothetical protein OCU04_009832 [Sclerotinia nivalis]